MNIEGAADILSKHWPSCSDALGLALALQRLGVLKVHEPIDDRETELVCAVLEQAAERLVNFSTNPLYHKALLRGAKIIREMKHEQEMRTISTFRQTRESPLRGGCDRADEQDEGSLSCG